MTRGKRPYELDKISAWQCGPDFLNLPTHEWPILTEANILKLPERKVIVNMAIKDQKETLAARIDISRFSKFQRLVNTTARILNLYDRFKKSLVEEKNEYSLRELNPDVLHRAEKLWVRDAQEQHLDKVKNGKFDRFCPQVSCGIIYVGGRVSQVIQPAWNQQSLILLPYRHQFSRLLAEHEHVKGGHLGVAASVARVRLNYWVINVFNMTKSIRFKCVVCRRRQKLLCGQKMADLPLDRLMPTPPFHNTGID